MDSDFGRTLFTDSSPVTTGPFYASPCSWAVHITYRCISTGENACVLDTSGNIVSGLYAIGECAGRAGIDNMLYGLNLADYLTASA